MNFLKKHIIISALILLILLTLLFVIGEASFKESITTALDTLPPQTQIAAVSDFNSNLVAHYTFDDTANDSAGSNHGTASGGPTYVEGKVGKAIQFDGVDDKIVFSQSFSGVIGGSQKTFSAWVYSDVADQTGRVFTFCKASGSTAYAVAGSSAGRWTINYRNSDDTAILTKNSSATAIATNKWTHLVFIQNGTETVLYVDGVAKLTNSDAGVPAGVVSVNSSIGNYSCGSPANFFLGKVDDVRVYDRTLSVSEVQQLYNFVQVSSDQSIPDTTPDTNPPDDPVVDPLAPVSTTGIKNIYVKKDGKGNFTTIQAAVNSAKPGDTIIIAGGIYNEEILINNGGTQNAPITIKTSSEAGYNGKVTINGRFYGGGNWVTINGAKNAQYEPLVQGTLDNMILLRDQPEILKNNINLKVDGSSIGKSTVNIYGNGPNGLRILWTELTALVPTGSEDSHAIRINAQDPDNVEIAYNWIHDTFVDGVNVTQDYNPQWDDVIVHHNIIERTGDDGIVSPGGLTAHHNIVRHATSLSGHPDGIVGIARYWRIYNNIIYDWNTLPLYPGISKDHVISGLHVYGNLIYSRADYPDFQEGAFLMTVDAQYDHAVNKQGSWSDIVIANNTFVAGNNIDVAFNMTNRYAGNGAVIGVSNMQVYNNIFAGYERFNSGFGGGSVNFKGISTGWLYSLADLKFDNNVVFATDKKRDVITYQGIVYDNAEAFNQATPYDFNSSAEPSFKNRQNYDFALMGTDTVAKNRGKNLQSLNLPGLNQDLYGKIRGIDGVWDIGAFEEQSGGITVPPPQQTLPKLLLHYDFEDDWSMGTLRDKSGNSIDAKCQPGLVLDGQSFNQCPTVSTGPQGSKAAQFYGNTCVRESDYFAIPNSTKFKNMNAGSMSLWAYFDKDAYGGAKLIDTWAYQLGTWSLGRDSNARTSERATRFILAPTNPATSASDTLFIFPDNYVYSWNHYTITWDGSFIRAYFNGQLFSAVVQPTSLTSNNFYLALGTNTHYRNQNAADNNCMTYYSAPAGKYVFPNNGFLIGKMDDVRIYDKALSAQEIQSLVNKDATTTPPPTPLPGDFDLNGKVNSLDFSALSSKWNQSSSTHDLNKDGTVNSLDFSLMAQNWTG